MLLVLVLLKFVLYPVAAYYTFKLLFRLWVLYYARDPGSPYSHLPIPPGDFGLPIIGETPMWAIQGSKFNSIRRKKYGKLFSTNFIGQTMVKVTGPEYIKAILTMSHDKITTKFPKTVREIFGPNSIAISVNDIHKYKRRVFLRAFSSQALNSYIPIMRQVIIGMLSDWSDYKGSPKMWDEGRKFAFTTALLTLVGIDIENKAEKDRLFDAFHQMVTNMFALPIKYPGSKFSKGLKSRDVLHEILSKHILPKRRQQATDYQYMKENSLTKFPQRNGFTSGLQHAMDSENELKLKKETKQEGYYPDFEISDTSLIENVVEMIFAGFLTTASSSSTLIYNLIRNPHVFKKLENELQNAGLLQRSADECETSLCKEPMMNTSNSDFDNNNRTIISQSITSLTTPCNTCSNGNTVFEACDLRNRKNPTSNVAETSVDVKPNETDNKYSNVSIDKNSPQKDCCIDLDVLNSLTYLEQVFKESLRVGPPVLGGHREALKTIQLGNYRIPKGWTIIFNIRDTHESEWGENLNFDPDNFSAENWKDSRENKFKYLPFGGGDRLCIGRNFARVQVKLLVIEMIRKFKKWEFAGGKPPRLFAIPMLHPTNGMPLQLTHR